MAVAVALANITAAGGVKGGDLSASERKRLRLRWSMLSVKAARPILKRAGIELPKEFRKLHTKVLGFTSKT